MYFASSSINTGMSMFFCSTSSSSCLLSSLKIATRQKVGESTMTGQLETLVYNKCFFFSESLLHEPFDNLGGVPRTRGSRKNKKCENEERTLQRREMTDMCQDGELKCALP